MNHIRLGHMPVHGYCGPIYVEHVLLAIFLGLDYSSPDLQGKIHNSEPRSICTVHDMLNPGSSYLQSP